MGEDKELVTMPFVAHESSMSRMEAVNKRMFIIIVILIIGIFAYFIVGMLVPEEIVKNDTQEAKADNQSTINQTMGDE